MRRGHPARTSGWDSGPPDTVKEPETGRGPVPAKFLTPEVTHSVFLDLPGGRLVFGLSARANFAVMTRDCGPTVEIQTLPRMRPKTR